MGDLLFFLGYIVLDSLQTETEISSGLIEKIRQKDRRTIHKLYKEAYPMVENYILKNSGTPADVQDVFHDAFYLLIQKVNQIDFQLTSKASTFLVGIARNFWLKQLTKNEVNEQAYATEIVFEDLPEAEDLNYVVNVKKMNASLLSIGEPCRTILKEFYFLGSSMKAIAKQLHYANPATAKNQKYKCFMRLRKMMTGK